MAFGIVAVLVPAFVLGLRESASRWLGRLDLD